MTSAILKVRRSPADGLSLGLWSVHPADISGPSNYAFQLN